MKIVYILIVVGHVYAGSVVTFQEFNSLQSCNKAGAFISAIKLWGDFPTMTMCVEK